MSTTQDKKPPRRVRVPGAKNSNIYQRPDGRYEIGYRDSTSKQRWQGPFATISAARSERDKIIGAKAKGERVQPNPKLKFGQAADAWLAEQVSELRAGTQANYRVAVEVHLRPRWGNRLLSDIDVNAVAQLVRELRAEGKAETTIASILRAVSRVFKFAARRLGWHGVSPLTLLENGERPRISETAERRIYTDAELSQVLAASTEPWTTLFRLASIVGARESELLGLHWSDVELSDTDAATIRFTHQADRSGRRVELKTEEAKAVLPLPRSAATMLLEHKARSSHTGPRAFVFATRTGRPLGQRNVLRALYRAQERARTPDGLPTFPELFEHDEHGHLRVDHKGRYILRSVPRRELPQLPDFHALRHGAAMDCDDAEEARDLLRHRNSNVTRTIYRAHFSDRRRELLRAKMEARHGAGMEALLEATERSSAPQTASSPDDNIVDLQVHRAS